MVGVVVVGFELADAFFVLERAETAASVLIAVDERCGHGNHAVFLPGGGVYVFHPVWAVSPSGGDGAGAVQPFDVGPVGGVVVEHVGAVGLYDRGAFHPGIVACGAVEMGVVDEGPFYPLRCEGGNHMFLEGVFRGEYPFGVAHAGEVLGETFAVGANLACGVLGVDERHQRMIVAEAYHVDARVAEVGFLGCHDVPVAFPVGESFAGVLKHIEVLHQRA